ncbi:NADH dehydrogenase [ubiquinone] 1 alpha subcomplex assembly factor 8 isoform X4 [Prionailurus iriomotensis]
MQASTAPGGRLTKDLCVQEFEALRSCFAAAAKTTPRGGL